MKIRELGAVAQTTLPTSNISNAAKKTNLLGKSV
jgi:hypothetical protein